MVAALSHTGHVDRAFGAMKVKKRRIEVNREMESDPPPTGEWATRPGWYAWGDEAGAGPGVIPLEDLWSTEKEYIKGWVDSIRRWARKPFGDDYPRLPNEVRPDSVREAAQKLEAAIEEARTLIQKAVKLAGPQILTYANHEAGEEKIVPAEGELAAHWLKVNEVQKVAIGRCGKLGCCEDVAPGKRLCIEHHVQSLTPEQAEKEFADAVESFGKTCDEIAKKEAAP
jgi:hypothetical protein